MALDLQQLNAQLSEIGTVSTLEEVGNRLNISIQNITNKIEASNSFNQIAIITILPEYPIIEVISLEGDSLKAIFSN